MRVLALLACLSLGCSTIYIDNGPPADFEEVGPEHWHNVGVLELVEFDDPVNLAKACDKGWHGVKIRQGIPHSVIWFLVGMLYSPWEVSWECK